MSELPSQDQLPHGQLPTRGRLAGIDYGHVRIGIAISDPSQHIASPYQIHRRGDEAGDAEFFRKFVHAEDIAGFVVGLPLHTSGDESEKSLEARRFAAWLQQVTTLPIQFHDERYTTLQAEQALLAAQLTKKKRKQRLDMLAAQMILASYLDSNRVTPELEPLEDKQGSHPHRRR